MANTHEAKECEKTHAEIIAECYHNTAATQYVRKLLDRLDAAHRRECGDCARLREALETLADVVETWQDHLPSAIREGELAKAIEKAEAALATTSNQNTQEN